MTAKVRRDVFAGLFIALGVPLACWLLALLIEKGIAPYDPLHALLDQLGLLSLSEVALGPIGILIAGRSAGLRGAALVVLVIVAAPGLALAWFVGAASLSGSLGNPF